MQALILSFIFLGILWWWLSRRGKNPLRRLMSPSRGGSRSAQKRIPSRLLRDLDKLTRDRRVSERLIERIEFNNPGRSKRWCVEKAIYDLQRDRRS
ncbi:MAG: hypothetical protein AAGH78_15665 [Cyanobacteria bacterium P01_H01_bin.58]